MGLLQEIREARKHAMEAIKMYNTPNPECEDKCKYAQTTHLYLCNNLADDIKVTDIALMCLKCGQSIWKINKAKINPERPRLPDRTILLNGTERQIRDNSHGVYIAYLDEDDANWIDKQSVRK